MAPLHDAAAQGSLTTLVPYLSSSPHFDIDEPDRKGRTALAYAALKGHIDVVKLLVSEGANVNKINDKNRSALWYASHSHSSVTKQKRLEVVEHLLHKGANPDVQAQDGTTAIMKLIEHREPTVIKLLAQGGASMEVKKGSKCVSVETLAKATNDQAVIQAIKHMPAQVSSRDELVTELVNYVLKSIGFMNHTLGGVVKKIFGIGGTKPLKCAPEKNKSNNPDLVDVSSEKKEKEILASRIFRDANTTGSLGLGDTEDLVKTLAVEKDENETPSIPLVSEISEHTTAEEFQASMMKFISDSGLDDFFPEGDDFLQTIAKKAVELQDNPENLLNEDEDIQDITKLSLYQPVFYCDDSTSMKVGTRQADQIDLVRRVARISTLLVPEGYGTGLLFINDKRPMDETLNAEQVGQIMESTKPRGNTKIGTQLEQKILKPLIYDRIERGERLQRPVLISCITDGCASGEPATKFKDTIVNCIDFLDKNGYPPQTVRFQISQIGNDSTAASFLNSLRDDATLEDVLFCTTQRLDEEYKKFNQNEEDLERWLLKTLMGPIYGLGRD
ncbi:hypothetical protein V8C42DRAFT_345114 [Trichoderma barbatum]